MFCSKIEHVCKHLMMLWGNVGEVQEKRRGGSFVFVPYGSSATIKMCTCEREHGV